MDPITVTICAGTACTVMDDSRLLLLEEALPAALQGRVKVRGERCLDHCQGNGSRQAPYVRIDTGAGNEIMAQATVDRVIARLEELLA